MKKIILLASAFACAAILSAKAADGGEVYAKNCAKCHGEDGKGQTKMGEKLGCKDYTKEAIKVEEGVKAVKEGLKDKEGKTQMKAFGESLSDEEIKAAVEHLAGLKK
ncbi:MAG TPA: cytochrome c [Verrucomicrobiae bacterium]|jgi:mono/diheme cytochrome c family protein|nr:cytochrome c [Verrucomicrobiae bacterium]